VELLFILGLIVLILVGSVVLAVRYGYRSDERKIHTLERRLKKDKPGWKIWI
jgi:hypothetical protein